MTDQEMKELRHSCEVERDVFRCAMKYLVNHKIKSNYEREMLDFASAKVEACDKYLARRIDF